IANEGDLWTVLVDRLQRELVDGRAFDDTHVGLATVLGRRTAELHAALAAVDGDDPGGEPGDDARAARMRPEPFTPAWQQHLLDGLHAGLDATRSALAGATASPDTALVLDRAR